MVSFGGLDAYEVRGWYAQGAWHVWGEVGDNGPETGLELATRVESLDFGDGQREVPVAGQAEAENHGPLPDGWGEAVTVGATGYFGMGLRATLAWQGIRFSHDSFSPDHDEDSLPGAGPAGAWVSQFFVRTMFAF